MTDGLFEPGDWSVMQVAAEQIVGSLLKEKSGLIDEALTSLKKESVKDLSKLLATGESVTADETEAEFDEPELIEASDEDIESIMSDLLKGNPEFEDIEEDVRRRIVVDAVYTVLAEEA